MLFLILVCDQQIDLLFVDMDFVKDYKCDFFLPYQLFLMQSELFEWVLLQ